MRYHTNLAVVARRTGFPVTEVAGWQSRGDGPMSDRPQGVVCHHTAGPLSGDMPSLRVLTDGRAGLTNALCNYGLGRSGRIYVVAAGEAWHAGVVNSAAFLNSTAFGIEAENTGVGERWAAPMVESYARLCAELCRAFSIPHTMVRGHKEVCSPRGRKIDPAGIDMNGFRALVAARIAHPTTSMEDDQMNEAQEKELHRRIGVNDANGAVRTASILAAVAAEGTSPAELEAGLKAGLATQAETFGDAIATRVVEKIGGNADAALIKQVVVEVLTEGTGGTP